MWILNTDLFLQDLGQNPSSFEGLFKAGLAQATPVLPKAYINALQFCYRYMEL
jgi:hypothetical protein